MFPSLGGPFASASSNAYLLAVSYYLSFLIFSLLLDEEDEEDDDDDEREDFFLSFLGFPIFNLNKL